MTTKPRTKRPLGEANSRAQRAQCMREAEAVQRYWRVERKCPDVFAYAAFDEEEKRYVVRSNLINGAPPPPNKNLRR